MKDAEAAGIRVAFSNPCFELWFLLHFDASAGERDRSSVQRELRQHLPAYGKSASMYRELLPRQDAAHRNAESLRQRHEECSRPVTSNPSTTVHRLVAELNEMEERQTRG